MSRKFAKVEILSNELKRYVVENATSQVYARSHWVKKTLSPSVDFMCIRKTFYNLKYTGPSSIPPNKKEITYEGERAKENGNDFHEKTQKRFEKMGILLFNELTLEDPQYRIKARIDSLVEIDGEVYLVELKSSKDYSIKLLTDEGAPTQDHQWQIQLYFHLFDVNKNDPKIIAALNGRELKKCLVFYENKNDHSPLEFLVHKDQDVIETALKFAKDVWEYHEKDETPEFKFEPDSFECKYKCSLAYYNKCHQKPKPEKIKNVGWGFTDAQKLLKDMKF